MSCNGIRVYLVHVASVSPFIMAVVQVEKLNIEYPSCSFILSRSRRRSEDERLSVCACVIFRTGSLPTRGIGVCYHHILRANRDRQFARTAISAATK